MNTEPPELLVFEKDKAGRRIYEVMAMPLPGHVVIMSLDRLVALAAEYGTPHFRAGRLHYAYLPYDGLAVARDDGAAAKPASLFSNHQIPTPFAGARAARTGRRGA